MGIGDTLAFAALMIGLIAVAGMVFEGYKARLKLKAKEIELRLAEVQAGSASADEAVAAKLEARVRVLERLATDKSGALAREIEDLRAARVD